MAQWSIRRGTLQHEDLTATITQDYFNRTTPPRPSQDSRHSEPPFALDTPLPFPHPHGTEYVLVESTRYQELHAQITSQAREIDGLKKAVKSHHQNLSKNADELRHLKAELSERSQDLEDVRAALAVARERPQMAKDEPCNIEDSSQEDSKNHNTTTGYISRSHGTPGLSDEVIKTQSTPGSQLQASTTWQTPTTSPNITPPSANHALPHRPPTPKPSLSGKERATSPKEFHSSHTPITPVSSTLINRPPNPIKRAGSTSPPLSFRSRQSAFRKETVAVPLSNSINHIVRNYSQEAFDPINLRPSQQKSDSMTAKLIRARNALQDYREEIETIEQAHCLESLSDGQEVEPLDMVFPNAQWLRAEANTHIEHIQTFLNMIQDGTAFQARKRSGRIIFERTHRISKSSLQHYKHADSNDPQEA